MFSMRHFKLLNCVFGTRDKLEKKQPKKNTLLNHCNIMRSVISINESVYFSFVFTLLSASLEIKLLLTITARFNMHFSIVNLLFEFIYLSRSFSFFFLLCSVVVFYILNRLLFLQMTLFAPIRKFFVSSAVVVLRFFFLVFFFVVLLIGIVVIFVATQKFKREQKDT